MKTRAAIALTLLAGVSGVASAQFINFEELGAQPPVFNETTALRAQYAAQGVTFSGAGALDGGGILNQAGNFGLNARSGEHFLAFNTTATFSDGGTPTGPQTITFAGGASAVSIYGAIARITMTAFNDDNVEVGNVTIGADLAWQELALTGNISYVVIAGAGSATMVLDDLSWTAIPAPSSAALAGILALGAARRRR